MRALLLPLALAAVAAIAVAGEQAKKNPVRALSVKVQSAGEPKGGGPKNPAVIKSDDDLAKVFADEGTRKAVAKEVDFAKEQVLYFSWGGSGGDKLSVGGYDAKANEATLSYKAGLTRDFRPHNYLFALPKEAKWKVEPLRGK